MTIYVANIFFKANALALTLVPRRVHHFSLCPKFCEFCGATLAPAYAMTSRSPDWPRKMKKSQEVNKGNPESTERYLRKVKNIKNNAFSLIKEKKDNCLKDLKFVSL